MRGGGRKLVRGRSDITELLRGTDVEGLDLLPADFSYRHMDLVLDESGKPTRRLRKVLAPLADHYDVAVLDCPPSISLVSESVFDAADALLVPLIPSTLTLRTFEQLGEFVRARSTAGPRSWPSSRWSTGASGCTARSSSHCPVDRSDVAASVIPAATEVELMGVDRAPVVVSSPRSRGARAYTALWAEMRERLAI